MPWYLIIAIVAILLLAGIIGAAFMCINMVMKPMRQTKDQAVALDAGFGMVGVMDDFENEWKRQPFTAQCASVTLRGEFILNPDDTVEVGAERRRRVVIICHGHTANRYSSVKYANIFYRAGYSCVIYDERYFGDSDGKFCTLGQEETKDLVEIIRLTREVFGQRCILGLHGESMGAATALAVLAQETPAFVVADCPFSSTRRLLKEQMGSLVKLPAFPVLNMAVLLAKVCRRYDIRAFNPIESVKKTQTPICFMHGSADGLINCDHSKSMYSCCNNPRSELHLFENADHAQSIFADPDGYAKTVGNFVRSVVGEVD